MGSTETRPKDTLQHDYRLVRRYISQFYCSQITIIQHKHTKQLLAMRQAIFQSHPQKLQSQLQTHKSLTHRNIIQIRNYWIDTDLGMCSTMLRLQVLFEYHQNTLEDMMNQRAGRWEDWQVVDFVRQIGNGLGWMERKGGVGLLAGGRNIAVAEGQRAVDDSKAPRERGLSQVYDKQRNSLADLSRNHSRIHISQGMTQKRIYKLFQPFQGIASTKSLLNMQNYMQVPLIPQLLTRSTQHSIPDHLIKQQNTHTICLLALAMAQGCQVFELDVFKNNRFAPQKMRRLIQQVKQSHPRAGGEMMRLLNRSGENRPMLMPFRIKSFPFMGKEEEVERGVGRIGSRKRLSLLQAH